MVDNIKIGRAIRTLREKAGLTQKDLADKLFVSSVAVSKWERGKSLPDIPTLRELAVLLEMDVDGLIDGTSTYMDDKWKGILILGGSGSAAAWELLYDKPVIDYLLGYFLLAGVRNILIGCGEKERTYIEARFRGGEVLNVKLRFVDSSEIGPAALLAEHGSWLPSSDIMLITQPFFLYGVDLTRFMQRAMQREGTIINMTSVVGHSDEFEDLSVAGATYFYESLPLFFLNGDEIVNHIAETWDIFLGKARSSGELRLEPMDKGFVTTPLNGEESLKLASDLTRIIQILGKYKVYCPLEIAYRRGMISRDKMLLEGTLFPEYREYVETI